MLIWDSSDPPLPPLSHLKGRFYPNLYTQCHNMQDPPSPQLRDVIYECSLSESLLLLISVKVTCNSTAIFSKNSFTFSGLCGSILQTYFTRVRILFCNYLQCCLFTQPLMCYKLFLPLNKLYFETCKKQGVANSADISATDNQRPTMQNVRWSVVRSVTKWSVTTSRVTNRPNYHVE